MGAALNTQNLRRMHEEFVVDGITVLSPDMLPDVDDDTLYDRAAQIYTDLAAAPSKTAHLDTLGDRALVQAVPELQVLLNAPALVAALETLVGPDYLIHPHCFLHEATGRDQVFHQDGNLPWNERGHYRSHRPDWALLFYYPQAVTLANGPTEIAPGTQYWTKDFEREDGRYHPGDAFDRAFFKEVMDSDDIELRDTRNAQALASLGVPDLERRFVTVPKGSVAICHYDIVHRGSRQAPEQPGRYMYKFYFARTRIPASRGWAKPAAVRRELKPVVDEIWRWTDGVQPDTVAVRAADCRRDLEDGREDEKVAAAYNLAQLARQGEAEARSALGTALTAPTESTRRAAAYGVRALGPEAKVALPALEHTRVGVRRMAAFALGTEALGDDADVLEALLGVLCTDEDDLARSNAAYALGQIARSTTAQHVRLFTALLARLAVGVEPNNTEVALLPRSTVRQSVAYALLQAACNHGIPEACRADVEALRADDDRYVAGFVEEVLTRAGEAD
ncbi:MAG: HEAT repeat domain-containing protein [Pseudomonadota bacterium]